MFFGIASFIRVQEKKASKHLFSPKIRGLILSTEDATIGAFLFCELMFNLSRSQDLDDEIDDILREFEDKCQRSVLHNVSFY